MKSKIFLSERQLDEQIGERLKYYRKRKNLTQGQLSQLLGISAQQLQKYEIGKNKISASRLKLASSILEIPTVYFYGESSNYNKTGSKFAEDDGKSEVNRLLNCYFNIKSEKIRKMILSNASTYFEMGL